MTTVLWGCSLNQEPETSWTDGAFYETEGQIQALLEGAYVKLENALGVGFMVYGDIRSDLYRCYNTNKVEFLNIMDNVITPYNSYSSWANFYAAIQQANLVLSNAPEMYDQGIIGQDCLNEIMGEAYCLRAFAYFWITRIWGAAPLVLKPAISSDYNARMKRSSEGELLASIHADLEAAYKLLPDDSEKTHFTLSAAWAITAQVCAWEKDWNGVIEACDRIDPQKYELAELYKSGYVIGTTAFMKYIEDSEYARIFNMGGQSESIFELSFSLDDSSDSKLLYGMVGYSETIRPDLELLSEYKMIRNKDWRYFVNFYDDTRVTKYFINYSGLAEDTRNVVLLRMTEIVLLKAEAQIELAVNLGGDEGNKLINDALSAINRIRTRAGGEDNMIEEVYTIDNVEDLKELLAEERKFELYGEGYRFLDLVRTGKVIDVMGPRNNQNDIRSILWPVYYTEMIYSNGSIEQNEYYK